MIEQDRIEQHIEQRNITIGNDIYAVCPEFHMAAITCNVKNSSYNEGLWQEIHMFCTLFSDTYKMEEINKRPAIYATREVYKKLGKDPNRYRPSAEALCRRILKGQELYRINTLVDLINLVSLKTGYSIGGFDASKIVRNLWLGVGKAGERFEAIGRGLLNIEGLPVYRDAVGGIGTPTSDEERTKITADTSHLLLIINGYSGMEGLQEAATYAARLLVKYADARNMETKFLSAFSTQS
ncbi:MAG: phenylalanine--tRNA ligase beta subunit-related protein [Parabacteroides sp.]|nr:phenylalanine--tRNA ligase beta subunit-related protein [Parabacteroides sp.]